MARRLRGAGPAGRHGTNQVAVGTTFLPDRTQTPHRAAVGWRSFRSGVLLTGGRVVRRARLVKRPTVLGLCRNRGRVRATVGRGADLPRHSVEVDRMRSGEHGD